MKKLLIIFGVLLVTIASVIASIISYGQYFIVISQGPTSKACGTAAAGEGETFCESQCQQQGYDHGEAVNCHGTYNPANQQCRYTCNCACTNNPVTITTTIGNF